MLAEFARPESSDSLTAGLLRGLLLVLLVVLAGCASRPVEPEADATAEPSAQQAPPATAKDIEPTVVAYEPPPDPLIRVNRAIFAFNDVTFRYVFAPLSKGYEFVVPRPVRTGIGNAFDNIKMPIRTVNFLLQGRFRAAGIDTTRFLVNSTVGLAGLFDPAEAWLGLKQEDTGFVDTLDGYGAGQGTFIVIPFYGPADLRRGSGLIVDYFLNPIPYLVDQPEATLINGFDLFQEYGPSAQQYKKLQKEAEDPYIFMRNLYMQGVQRDEDYPRKSPNLPDEARE
ncbi:VacJ family lipoprotein [uncultured Abyssibacter sp.]|uniref:MlaA family lipoprotein n=1 Tax=uncultured Abyssibacter sp. TaxID=2320202 RepID=UPI0032B11F39